jgi:hypothetical protein
MFFCPQCEEPKLKLKDYQLGEDGYGEWVCEACGHTEIRPNRRTHCFNCLAEYWETSWFLPGSCPKCHTSFTD